MPGKPNDKWLETMIKKHGSREAVTETQRIIGAKGGRNGRTGGFSKNIVCTKETCEYELDPHYIKQCAGSRGGQASRRGKAKA